MDKFDEKAREGSGHECAAISVDIPKLRQLAIEADEDSLAPELHACLNEIEALRAARPCPAPQSEALKEAAMDAVEWKRKYFLLLSGESVAGSEDMRLLDAIERYCADDFCEELDMIEGQQPEQLSDREKQCHLRLSAIYKLAHSHNRSHSCYKNHSDCVRAAIESEGKCQR